MSMDMGTYIIIWSTKTYLDTTIPSIWTYSYCFLLLFMMAHVAGCTCMVRIPPCQPTAWWFLSQSLRPVMYLPNVTHMIMSDKCHTKCHKWKWVFCCHAETSPETQYPPCSVQCRPPDMLYVCLRNSFINKRSRNLRFKSLASCCGVRPSALSSWPSLAFSLTKPQFFWINQFIF